ncbi:MAG: saccharopine dehydrogenase NADP-binding domain-containing protein [Elusimicrobia bacterium]|nr:saccharopine dehydrogenase NADP-binding domain-containing protein [Elusimicrobiota bacterium]
MKTFVVLGGAGAMGRITVRDLAEFAPPADRIIIADYNLAKAKEMARSLKLDSRLGGNDKRIEAIFADVTKPKECAKKLKGAFIIINCVQYQFNLRIMEIALLAGAHYIDLGGLFHMTRKQLKLNARFKKKNLLAILGMGAAPGITNLLAWKASERLDRVNRVDILVAGTDKTNYDRQQVLPVSYSLKTILEEFSKPPAVFKNGRFGFLKPTSADGPHQFPQPIGQRTPMFTLHSEVATLPISLKPKGVREVAFRIAFDPVFTERVRLLCDLGFSQEKPVQLQGVKVAPIDVVNRLAMNQAAAKPMGPLKQFEVLRAVVKGTKNGHKTTITADCRTEGIPEWGLGTDVDTGCPPSIAALMIASGEIQTTGARPPETAVPADLFFKHLELRKMRVSVSIG